MEHIRIATYEIKQGSFQEIADAAKGGMLRKFQEQPGFLRYGVADVGDKTLLSISLWGSRKDAESSVLVAANWVRENLGEKIELRNTRVGDLAFFEGVPATV
jgi:heme-degrading monooxygenase HmoA